MIDNALTMKKAGKRVPAALKPKGILFFVAFLPQFISPHDSVTRQRWVLAITFVIMATGNATLYATFAASARRLLASARAQRRFNLAGGSLLSIAGATRAEVAETTPTGFLIKLQASVDAPPDKAYRAFADIGRWWNADHTYSGDATNLSLDARPGACFCEKLANGGGVQHMSVVYVAPGQTIRLAGGLGPLQGSGLAGSTSWKFTPDAAGKPTVPR